MLQSISVQRRKDDPPEVVGLPNTLLDFDPNTEPQQEENSAQQGVLDALEATKVKMNEVAPFLMNKPEKPVLDEERMKKAKNMTTVGFAGQLFEALSAIALGRANSDYNHVPSGISNLGMSGLEALYGMDAEHRDTLRRYDDQVFRIDQQNQLTEAQIGQNNKNVDVQIAQTKLGFENNEQMQALQGEIANLKADKDTTERYIEPGLRLISQGQEEAGLALLEKAGMDVESARELLGANKQTTSVASRIAEYLGREKVSKHEINMIEQYHELMADITENPAEGDYNSFSGEAMSERAKKLEALGRDLGDLRHVPMNMLQDAPLTMQPPPQAGSTGAPAPAQNQTEGSHDNYIRAISQNIFDYSGFRNVPPINQGVSNYLLGMKESIIREGNEDMQRAGFQRMQDDLFAMGYSPEEVEQLFDGIFGVPQADNQGSSSEESLAQTPESAGTTEAPDNSVEGTRTTLVKEYNNGNITKEQLKNSVSENIYNAVLEAESRGEKLDPYNIPVDWNAVGGSIMDAGKGILNKLSELDRERANERAERARQAVSRNDLANNK
jgi:hypothetical protein